MRVAHNSKLTIQNCHRQPFNIPHSTFHIQKKETNTLNKRLSPLLFFSDLLSKKITQQRSPQP